MAGTVVVVVGKGLKFLGNKGFLERGAAGGSVTTGSSVGAGVVMDC